MGISVVIPVGDDDEAWQSLLPDLRYLSSSDEIIFVSSQNRLKSLEIHPYLASHRVSIIDSPKGRAKQMNAGAQAASCEVLWFVHCDTRFLPTTVNDLHASLKSWPDALHYFDLKFLQDGPKMMCLTELGVYFRSRVLRIPFGDQAFCLSREMFTKLGKFDETVPFGEDHLFVWAAHQSKVRLQAVGRPIYTSARKYQLRGWARTTARHLQITVQQALPQLHRLWQIRGVLWK